MNVFGGFTQRFLATFVDYTMLREVGKRIADVEEIVATTERDRKLIHAITNNPAARDSLLMQLYEQFVKARNDINKYEPLRSHYLVMAMIDTLSHDILAVDPRTNKTFDIVVDKRYPSSNRANKLLQDFRENTNLDKYVALLLYDAIFYGNYWVEYIYDKQRHIVGLKDAYQPGSIFTVGMEGITCDPLYYKLSSLRTNEITLLDNQSIACLDMQSDRYRYSLSSMFVSLQSRDGTIAQTGRVGRPFCYNIYDKLINLEMLEQLDLAGVSATLQRNSLISVTAPEGLDLNQLKEFSAYYEKIINNNGGDGPSSLVDYDIDSLRMFAAESTKFRVIPQQPQRGAMTLGLSNGAVASEGAAAGVLERILNIRNLIMDIKGIPSEFVFTGREENKPGGALRRYARYAREVKEGQASVQAFLKRIVAAMLASYGMPDVAPYILVSQYCAINTSELDRLECADAAQTVINNVFNTLMTVTNDPAIAPYVDQTARAAYVETLLDGLAGATQIVNVPTKAPEGNGVAPTKKNS